MPVAPSYSAFPPDKPALVMGGDGRTVTFGELESKADRGAQLLRAEGFADGEVLAICMPNRPELFEVVCAALRCGLTFVPIPSKLTAPEAAFIIRDSGAKALVLSDGVEVTADAIAASCPGLTLYRVGSELPGTRSWDGLRAAVPAAPLRDARRGKAMLYSSGTTGRQKGVVHDGAEGVGDVVTSSIRFVARIGGGAHSTYLSTAPLYHAAPLGFALAVIEAGGTVVVMEHFDAEHALRLIERHRVDLSQWVPTHFVRLLKLDAGIRGAYDLSSLRLAVHAAAPCPVPVKHAMIEWWGPILLEFYGSTEQAALTIIDSEQWLAHEGSVGRCHVGTIHICDDEGDELPVGEVGTVYCEGGLEFSYLGDPGRTSTAHHAKGWTTVGDIGRLDEDGYLYLTDRKNFMIITGGVNVYPQEIEDLLVTHPQVVDAAVIGVPDEDLGEAVTAFVQLVDPSQAGDELAEGLRRWLRASLSSIKVPKKILFRDALPRLPTGKMAKHVLKSGLSGPAGPTR
ncbi:MAG: acyl-CoA synthetase [Gammaproteobacteria bacterium]|nr:acyl-CoA synthetase [Gammaproteobacteria bacterium]